MMIALYANNKNPECRQNVSMFMGLSVE